MVSSVFSLPCPAPLDGLHGAHEGTAALREYIGDESNRLVETAVSSALARNCQFNPLLLHGATGTGKTLLAELIFSSWQESDGCYQLTTGVEFARQYAQAVDLQAVDEWREQYRQCNGFVLDGIEALDAKPAAQKELISTIDDLADNDCQLVFTANALPVRNPGLFPQLASRLSSGLLVSLEAPGAQAQQRLLERILDQRGLKLDEVAWQALRQWCQQQSPRLTVPQMVRAINQLSYHAEDRRIQVDDIQNTLRHRAEQPSLNQIAQQVAMHFNLPVKDLRGATRKQPVVRARSLAMFLSRQLTQSSLQQVGDFFGRRDHTTVLHSCRKIESALESDPSTRTIVHEIKRRIENQLQPQRDFAMSELTR